MELLTDENGLTAYEQMILRNVASAALSGNLEELELLTRNQRLKSMTPCGILEKVISSGQIDAAKMIISRGCFFSDKPSNTTPYETTLLQLAISTGNRQLVQTLLKKIHYYIDSDLDKIPTHFKIVDFFSSDLEEFSLIFDSITEKLINIDPRYISNNFYILHYAAEKGKDKIIPLLIEKEGNINAQSQDGSTALHKAVKNRHLEVVKVLLNHGADDTIFTKGNMTPLCLAIQNGDFNIFKVFLEFCSQTSNTQISQRVDNKVLVYLATTAENVEMVKLLLSNGATVNSHSLKTGQSALHLAAENGNLEIVNELLKYEVDFKVVDSDGFTPLHVACAEGNVDVICALLSIDKYELGATSKTGLTSLHIAAKAGHSEAVTLLLERGADFTVFDQNNRTPLAFAIENTNGDAKTLEVLLTKIRRVESASSLTPDDQVLIEYHFRARNDKTGNSALHIAVQNEDEASVVLLLNQQTCINVLNQSGQTPLDLATINGSLSIVNIFLQSRDDPQSLFVPKENGYTPVHLAVEDGNIDMLELFFKAGISANIFKPNALTPLHIAVQKNDVTLVMLLLKNGAKVNVSGTTDLETPLFIAAENGNAELLEILLNACTNVSSQWREGCLLMHIAAYYGHEIIVEILLDKGIDSNANVDKYLTPLHAAAQNGKENIVKILLRWGAKVNPKRLNGENYFSTPLLAASHAGHSKIVSLLLQHGANCNTELKSSAENFKTMKFKQLESNSQKLLSKSEQILVQGNYNYSEVGDSGSLLQYTSLHFAVKTGDEATVKLLINKGINVNAKSRDGAIPIGLAIEKENLAIIKHLLSTGINLRMVSHKQKSIFLIKSLKKNLNLVMMLIEYATQNDNTPKISSLLLAVRYNLEAYVQKFFETRVDGFIKHEMTQFEANLKLLSIVKSDTGISDLVRIKVLNEAICNKNVIIMEILLKNFVHNLNSESLFCFALQNSSPQVVKKFLDFGFSVHLQDDNKKGLFPIFHAVAANNLTVVYFLLRKGASVKTIGKGQTLMDFALSNIGALSFSYCHNMRKNRWFNKRTAQILMDYGADVVNVLETITIEKIMEFSFLNSVEPNYLNSPMHRIKLDKLLKSALEVVNIKAVKLLLLNGANAEFFDEKGSFPFKIMLREILQCFYKGYDDYRPTEVTSNELDDLQYDKQLTNRTHKLQKLDPLVVRFRKIFRLLTQEISRQLSFNNTISEKSLSYIYSDFMIKYYERCQQEIQLMKMTKICRDISYFEVLVANFTKLVSLTVDRDIRLIILKESEVSTLFPVYAEFLIERITIGSERRHLLDTSFDLLKKIFHFEFPPLIVEKILSFLSNYDLNILKAAFNNYMFDE